MALYLKQLSRGTLSTTAGSLMFQVPPNKSCAFKVTLTNSSTSALKVNLYLEDYRIAPKDMELDPGDSFTSCQLTAEQLDVVSGDATASSLVEYVISGILRS